MDGLKAPREFSQKRRDKLADTGAAMPDGSYPIPDKDALRRAIQSFGRAKNPDAVKQHIIKRARALGATAMLPEGWASGKGSMAASHAADAADILEDLYELIACEAPEPHANLLKQAAALVTQFLTAEHGEIGTPDDIEAGSMMNMGKAAMEIKAEPMDTGKLDLWLQGKIPRRKLVIPFTGPLPGGKSGLDLDGEYFDAETDLYGPLPALKATRERLVDWHHDEMYRALGQKGDPTGFMDGAILGREIWDESPESAGLWADWWMNAGERRKTLIETLEKRGGTLYGSSQAVSKYIKKADDGHILVWPVYRDTVTTSPQNTHAVIPPLKAVLAALPDDVGLAAVKAAAVGWDEARSQLRSLKGGSGSPAAGKGAGKAYVLTADELRMAHDVGKALALLTR